MSSATPAAKDSAKTPARNDEPHASSTSNAAELRAAVQQLQETLKSAGRAAEFHIDSATGMTVVTIKDSATGEVIRQMPSEELLALARHLGGKPGNALLDLSV